MKLSKNTITYGIMSGLILCIFVVIIVYNNKAKTVDNETTTNEIAEADNASTFVADTDLQSETIETKSESTTDNQSTFKISKEVTGEIKNLVKVYYNADKVDEEVLTGESEKVNEKVADSINEKREGIEAYKNIKTYIRAGLENDTYIVFSTYNTKFYNIDTLAPGMSVLYIVKDDSGSLAINTEVEDETLNKYINTLMKEDEEVESLVDTTNTKFIGALKKDEALKTFIEKLETKSN